MKISISDGDMTYGYRTIDVSFLSLGQITERYNYSVGLYSNGHRHHDNLVGTSELLMYDFDDGYPLDECIEYFESVGITAFFATSRNHQKVKGEGEKAKPACDRYRVLIPFDAPVALPYGEYQKFYIFIAALLGLDESIDRATQDPTRFFFPNPNQQTHYVLTGQLLNFKILHDNCVAYMKQQEKPKQQNKEYRKSADGKLKENELSRTHTIETKRGNHSFQDFEYLQGDDTAPCRCPNPSHPDRNPSAFVGRSKESGRLFVKCKGCQFLAFIGDV